MRTWVAVTGVRLASWSRARTNSPSAARRQQPFSQVSSLLRAVAVLIAMALQHNVAYLYTPAEILDGRAGDAVASGESRFRLGGMVADGSFNREAGSMANNPRAGAAPRCCS